MEPILPGQPLRVTDSADLSIFLQDVCEQCRYQETCSILAYAGMYGGCNEWRTVEGQPLCIHQKPLPEIDRSANTNRSGIPDVLPCPFCGHGNPYWDSVEIDEITEHMLMCQGCGCEGPHHPEQHEAAARWQMRKGEWA